MKLVLDTNVVVSGLFWYGPAATLLDMARSSRVQLFTSPILLAELEDVLQRRKFAARRAAAGVSAEQLVVGYAQLCAGVVTPTSAVERVVSDPDDDAVLATANAALADLIVSGDRHLLDLRDRRGISIASPADALRQIESAESRE